MLDPSLPWLDQITTYDPIWWEWESFDFELRAVFMLTSPREMYDALAEVQRAMSHIAVADRHIIHEPTYASIVVYFNEESLDWLSILRLQTSIDDPVQKHLMQIEKMP